MGGSAVPNYGLGCSKRGKVIKYEYFSEWLLRGRTGDRPDVAAIRWRVLFGP